MSSIPRHTTETNKAGISVLLRRMIFALVAVLCLTPFISAPVALLLGLIIAQTIGNPFSAIMQKHKVTPRLLQYSVVGLGFGMSIQSAIEAGKQGVLFTIITIFGTLILGLLLGYFFKIDKKTSHLISSGTAICGGSAIAAVAPVIKADEKQISVALGIVFILNSVALFIFPIIGNQLEMSQTQFGLWSAIAIHDTSSVVGAASKFGDEALQVATTVKLARALWIIPLAFFTAFFFKEGKQKIKIPYFIGFFILAMLANTYIPFIHANSKILVAIAKAGLVLTLFFIGASLSAKTLKSVGLKPLLQGLLLWVAIASGSLLFIIYTVT
ncbi:MAG TPA: putative sulfate exporter family transporter [Flavipsychrobacter sp.]|nr:putative sulfate exporter family transporter [Flavipsychrobacter sp.]